MSAGSNDGSKQTVPSETQESVIARRKFELDAAIQKRNALIKEAEGKAPVASIDPATIKPNKLDLSKKSPFDVTTDNSERPPIDRAKHEAAIRKIQAAQDREAAKEARLRDFENQKNVLKSDRITERAAKLLAAQQQREAAERAALEVQQQRVAQQQREAAERAALEVQQQREAQQQRVAVERAAPEAQLKRDAAARAHRRPLTPAAPTANRTQTALDLLLEKIEKTPEAQIQARVDDENNLSNNKAVQLSEQTSFCANTYPGGLTPAQVKTKAAAAEDTGRIIYHVEPTQEGPIFMPRKRPNGTTLKKDTGEIVYDMVWYEGNPLKATPEKSFIAPDGHPDGSKASVPFEIRSQCWDHHKHKQLASVASSLTEYLDVNTGSSPSYINTAGQSKVPSESVLGRSNSPPFRTS